MDNTDRMENHFNMTWVRWVVCAALLSLISCASRNNAPTGEEPKRSAHTAFERSIASRDAAIALLDETDALVQRVMAAEKIPGAAVIVVKNGVTLIKRGYGVADVVSSKPVDPDKTIFRIGSISKALTALAVTRLADKGKLTMNDPVVQYVPEFSDSVNEGGGEQAVRIRHLLTHTAGLDQIGIGRHIWNNAQSLDERLAARPTLTEFLSRGNLRRTSPPGAHYRYDTYAITLAGVVLENVTNLDYAAALERELFQPLGMAHSYVALDPRSRVELAIGHGVVDGQFTQTPYEVYVTQPASSIDSTAADMGRLLQALTEPTPNIDGSWLSASMRNKILTPHYRPHKEFPGITHGLNEYFMRDVAADKPVRVLGHGGSMLGFRSSLMIVPELQLGIVVLANRDQEAGGGQVTLHEQVNQAVIGAYFPGSAFKGFTIPPADLARDLTDYVGEYYYGVFCRTCSAAEFEQGGWSAGDPLIISSDDGRLALNGDFYYPTHDREVFVGGDGQNKIAFRRDRDGAITSFSFFTSPDAFERKRD